MVLECARKPKRGGIFCPEWKLREFTGNQGFFHPVSPKKDEERD